MMTRSAIDRELSVVIEDFRTKIVALTDIRVGIEEMNNAAVENFRGQVLDLLASLEREMLERDLLSTHPMGEAFTGWMKLAIQRVKELK